jgi:hypothetical protein
VSFGRIIYTPVKEIDILCMSLELPGHKEIEGSQGMDKYSDKE